MTRKWEYDRALIDVKPLPGWRAYYFIDGTEPAVHSGPVFLGVYAENRYHAVSGRDAEGQRPLTERPRIADYLDIRPGDGPEWLDNINGFWMVKSPEDPEPTTEQITAGWTAWKTKRPA